MDGGGGMDSSPAGDANHSSSTVDASTTELNGSACNGMVNAAYEPDGDAPAQTTPVKEGAKTNGEFKSPRNGDGKVAEAVNLELVSMSPYSNSIPVKKESTELDMTDPYDEYFVPVNQHKKYIRGEKLYVTQDKRENLRGGKRKCCCGVVTVIVLGAILAILLGVLLTQDNVAPTESSVARNYNKAGFGNNLIPTPPPESSPSSPPQTTDMSHMYLKNVLEGELTIDNMVYSPGLSEPDNGDFKTLATSLEEEIKKALFDYQTLNNGASDISVKVINFRQGSVIVTYRVGWTFKEGIRGAVDPITMDSLKMKLQQHIRQNDGFLYNYKIPTHSITSNRVIDGCQMENQGCSHMCIFNMTQLTITCSCPEGFVLQADMKTCSMSEGHHHSEESVPAVSSHPDESSDEEYQEFDHSHHSMPENTSEEGSQEYGHFDVHHTGHHEDNMENHDHMHHDISHSTEDTIPNFFEQHDHSAHVPVIPEMSTESPMVSSEQPPVEYEHPQNQETSSHSPIDHFYHPSPEDAFNPSYEVIEPEQPEEIVTKAPQEHHHSEQSGETMPSSTEGTVVSHESSEDKSDVHIIPDIPSDLLEIMPSEEPKLPQESSTSRAPTSVEFLPEYSTLSDSEEAAVELTTPTPSGDTSSSSEPTMNSPMPAAIQENANMETTSEEVTTAKNSDEDAETLSENDALGASFSGDNVTHLEMIDTHEGMKKTADDKMEGLEQHKIIEAEFTPTKGVLNVSEVMNHLPSPVDQTQGAEVSESPVKPTEPPSDMIFVTLPSTEKVMDNGNTLETFREAKAANLTTSTSENPSEMIVSLVSTESPMEMTENHTSVLEEMINNSPSLLELTPNEPAIMPSEHMEPEMTTIQTNEKRMDSEVPPDEPPKEEMAVEIAHSSEEPMTEVKEPSMMEVKEPSMPETEKPHMPEAEKPSMPEAEEMDKSQMENIDSDEPLMITVTKIPDLEGPLPVENSEINHNLDENHQMEDAKEDTATVDKLLKESSNSLNSLDDDFEKDKYSKHGKSKLIKDFNVKEVFNPSNETSESASIHSTSTSSPENKENQPIDPNSSDISDEMVMMKGEVKEMSTEPPVITESVQNGALSDEAFTTMHPLFTIKQESTTAPALKSESTTAAPTTEKTGLDPIFSNEAFTTLSPMFKSGDMITVKPSETDSEPMTTQLIIDLMDGSMLDDKDKPITSSEEEINVPLAAEVPSENKTLEQEEMDIREIDPVKMTEMKNDVTTMVGVTESMPESVTSPPSENSEPEHTVLKKEMENNTEAEKEVTTTVPSVEASSTSSPSEISQPIMNEAPEDPVVKLLYNSSYPNATLQFKCPSGQTPCKDGNGCVSHHQLCDSETQCMDKSDEEGCQENKCFDNFQCVDGTCLKRHLVCDGITHCPDKSDEAGCSDWKCKFDELQCLPMSKQCIPALWKCDGVPNCPGNVDEIGCKDSCENHEYMCPEGFCISMDKKCDGMKDCAGGEDELEC